MPANKKGKSRNVVRLLTVSVLLAVVVLLSGCIDVVQYISGSALDIDVYFRLTMQKSIFEMASSFGEQPQDLDAMFEEFDLNEEDVVAELPPGVEASFESINNDSEFGFELRYSAPRAALDSLEDGEAEFVPRVSPWGIVIPLGEGNGSADSDELADAFLGSAKYRLMISKRLVSRVSEARILAGPVSTPITVTELPDVWLLEFPMNLWYASDHAPTVEVLF
jgi:hypothetical protein